MYLSQQQDICRNAPDLLDDDGAGSGSGVCDARSTVRANSKARHSRDAEITLNVSLPTAAPGSGFMGMGGGSKDIDFTWGLEK